jgi:hypothetical protein
MGLDITAYRKLVASPNEPMEDGCPVDYDNAVAASTAILSWTEQHWPGRTHYILPGVYRFAEDFDFRAGSYSGYNRWREWLSIVAGHGNPSTLWEAESPQGPFVELINFADNEGIIGPTVSAKLAKDFAEHEDRIAALCAGNDRNYELTKYREWRKAFELAADGGMVEFH